MKKFIKDLKKSGGHVLQIITTADNKQMGYQREDESLVTDVKTKVF